MLAMPSRIHILISLPHNQKRWRTKKFCWLFK